MEPEKLEYDAVVLYYRRGIQVIDVVQSLVNQSTPPRRIVVVDNGSADGVFASEKNVAALNEISSSVSLVICPDNLGYAGGMNLGVRSLETNAKYLFFATHELRMNTDCAASLLETASNTGAAIVGPTLTLERNDTVWSYGGYITRWGASRHVTSRQLGTRSDRNVDWVDGSAILIDRRVFLAIDGFDERFFLYWEDVDICTRASAFGPVVVSARARASQDTGYTPAYYSARNRIMYWRSRRDVFKTLTSIAAQVRPLIQDMKNRRSVRARLLGMVHGLTGRLDSRSAPTSVAVSKPKPALGFRVKASIHFGEGREGK